MNSSKWTGEEGKELAVSLLLFSLQYLLAWMQCSQNPQLGTQDVDRALQEKPFGSGMGNRSVFSYHTESGGNRMLFSLPFLVPVAQGSL